MSVEKQILLSVSNGIGRLTFNRPEHANSIGLAIRADMVEGINRMTEPDVRVVVITGQGKFFSAGGDIGEFLRTGHQRGERSAGRGGNRIRALRRFCAGL